MDNEEDKQCTFLSTTQEYGESPYGLRAALMIPLIHIGNNSHERLGDEL